MKKLFLGTGLMLAVVVITFFSCSKDELVKPEQQNQQSQDYVTNNISLKNGMLVFKTQKIFEEKLNELSTMSRKEREEWEQDLGFISQATIYDRINDAEIALEEELFGDYDENLSLQELAALGVEIRHTDIYNKYLKKGIIKENKYKDGSESFELTVKEYEIFLNEEGLLMVGNSIYKYDEKYLKIIIDGDLSKIKMLNEINKSDEYLNIFVENKVNSNKDSRGWSNYKNGHWEYNSSKERFNLYVVGSSYTYSYDKYMKSTFYVESKAQKKKWGSWKYRNDYNPIYKIFGNWSYYYYVYNENNVNDYHYTTNLSDNDYASPFSYTLGHSNHCKFYLKPNGTWYYGAPWRFMNTVYVSSYNMTGDFYGGSNGHQIKMTRTGYTYIP